MKRFSQQYPKILCILWTVSDVVTDDVGAEKVIWNVLNFFKKKWT